MNQRFKSEPLGILGAFFMLFWTGTVPRLSPEYPFVSVYTFVSVPRSSPKNDEWILVDKKISLDKLKVGRMKRAKF